MKTCWEYLTCKVYEDCPAYPKRGHDCWNMEGTLCKGERQGAYEDKILGCRGGDGVKTCAYYNASLIGTR